MAQNKTPPMSPLAVVQQRPSMSAIRRRLSSAAVVMSTGTNQDAVLEATRQRYEDKKRRISIVSPKALRPATGEEKAPAVPGPSAPAVKAFDLLSPDDATEHYRQCLRLAIENKINKKNAFDLKLIENLESILTGKNRQNFALCASLVDVGTRIFGSRVDANDIELKRICTWLCGGASKDDENDDGETAEAEKAEDKDGEGNYGGNDSVLMGMKKEEKKKVKTHSRKAVIEEDNNKLTAPLEKRSKANPLMRGRRSVLSGGGISEGLASVLLLPTLAVTERPLNNESTTLNYVVSEAADRTFGSWIRKVAAPPPAAPNLNKKPRWSFEELGKLDLTKEICPPLHAIDLNKTFGNELEGINSTATDADDVSCEEALHSRTHLPMDGQDNGYGEETVRVIASREPVENADDDSFEMPGLEDQSIYPDNVENAPSTNQDCMLLVPIEDNVTTDIGAQTNSSSLPLASSGTFSIEQLHEILVKSLATGDNPTSSGGDGGNGVAPAWLLEQLVNGTVGKALKLRQKQPTTEAQQQPTAVKSRRNIVKVQKVAFSEELHQNAEQKLAQKYLPKGGKKQTMAAITEESDLPEPVVNHEFDELLHKLRDCFIMGGARTARVVSTEGIAVGHSLNRSVGDGFMSDVSRGRDDDDDYGCENDENVIPEAEPLLFGTGLDVINKSLSRHESMIMQRNFAEENGGIPSDFTDERLPAAEKEGVTGSAIGQMLLHQVRNATSSLAASLLPRRVDVRVAKLELWRSVEKNAPETRMSIAISAANDNLVANSTAQAASTKSSTQPSPPTSTLSPQMAFVCLLHLANEHNLTLQSSDNFADIRVKTTIA